MSKYANLPDIDTAPDTYQIDSPPLSPTISNQHESANRKAQENQPQSQSQSQSSNDKSLSATIQTDPINSKAATNSFRKATQLREQDALDYSDSIQPRPKRSLQSSSNKIPSLPPIYGSESDLYSTDPNLDSIPFDPYNPLLHSRSINESPAEKLLRLKQETDFLEKELLNSGQEKLQDQDPVQREENQSTSTSTSDSQSTTKLLSQLKYLQNRLNGVSFSSTVTDEEKSRNWQKEANNILQDLNSNSNPISENFRHQGLQDRDADRDGLQKVNRTRDLTLLDGRISEMEDLVGVKQILTGVDESSPLPRPLLPTLSKLEHQLLLLTQPRHLDAISRRVKVLASELNRVHEARKKFGEEMVLTSTNTNNTSTNLNPTNNSSSSTNTNHNPSLDPNSNSNSLLSDPSTLSRLNSLSKLQPRLESLLPIAPTILSRLKSLSNLHESSNDFHTNLEKLEKSFKNQNGRMKEIESVLKNVEESLKENREMVEGNLKGLEERLEGLGKRLKDL